MVPSRFNRDYELTIQIGTDRAVVVRPPMRVSFGASKSIAGGLNRLTARVYNLQPSNRLALVKDAEQAKRIPISFRVGYKDTLQLLFKGTVHRGQNMREGPDHITELECLDGGYDYLNSFTAKTVKGKSRAVDAVLGDMPNTGRGKLTAQNALIRPRVLVGASGQLIDDLINDDETWYIDEEKLYILKDDEVVSSFIPVVNAATGLLDTPTREQSKVTFNSLMNPTLKIGALCALESTSAPHLNGVYRIETIGSDGDTHGEKWTQKITALLAQGYKVL